MSLPSLHSVEIKLNCVLEGGSGADSGEPVPLGTGFGAKLFQNYEEADAKRGRKPPKEREDK
jgi:hypothetical protein